MCDAIPMKTPFLPSLLLALLFLFSASRPAFASETAGADALLAAYRDLRPKLEANVFGAPIHVESSEQDKLKRGEVYGVIAHPFARLAEVLRAPREWCAIALLHLNIKTCTYERADGKEWLNVYSGRKFYEPPEKAYALRYVFHVESARADYLAVTLAAESGPFGTTDHRIAFEAIPLESGTFVHFRYAYRSSLVSSVATAGYLVTFGSDKLGFTVTGRDSMGSPEYIGGVRGIVERNAMRYYLAMQAYFDVPALPKAEQFEARLQRWFELTEKYPKQLRELEYAEYREFKRKEYRQQVERQQALDTAATR